MAQVALAKATSFIALLRADGRLLDVTDAPLTSAGLDRHEVIGHLLWQTPWCRHSEDGAGRPAAGRRAGRRRALRALRRRADAGQRRAPCPRPSTSCCGRCAAPTAASRSSSPRAARSPTASARRSGSRARTPSCRCSPTGSRASTTTASGCSAELSHDLRAPLQIVLTRAERPAPPRRGEALRGARRRASGSPRSTRSSRSTPCSSRSAATTARRAWRWSTTTSPPTVRSVAEQFDALAAERGIQLVDRDARGGPRALRPRAHQPRGLQPARQRAALRAGRRRRPLLARPPTGETAVIEVADSGAGVPPEQRERALRALPHGRQRPAAAPAPASGWRSCKEFVALHGGDVALGEAPEGGALFTVRAPARAGRPPSRRRRGSRSSSPPPAAPATSRSTWPPSWPGTRPTRWPSSTCPSVLLVDRDAEPRRRRSPTRSSGRAGVFTATEARRGAAPGHRPAARHGRHRPARGRGHRRRRCCDRMAREWRLAGVLRVALVERGGDPAVRTRCRRPARRTSSPSRWRATSCARASACCSSTPRCAAAADAAEAELRRLRGAATRR